MHGTSLRGVSLTRLSHPADDAAPALEGTNSAAARHNGTIQQCRRRDLTQGPMKPSPIIVPRMPTDAGSQCEAAPLYAHLPELATDNGRAFERLRWALEFGNAGSNGSPVTLYFTAGPSDESHGLFGTITPC
jgi:hypothetical protein